MINLNTLNNFFLTPEWLLLSLALLPLIIIYLIKPSPKEQIMPSMAFFNQNKNEGKLRKALNRLLTNLLLILHILIILLAVLTVIQPFDTVSATQEQTVIILDQSMPVENDFEDLKNFAEENIGEKTTLIAASNSPELLIEEGDPQEVRQEIDNLEYKEVEQNIEEAIEMAQNFEGQMVIGSNFASIQEEELNSLIPQNAIHFYGEFNNNIGIIDKNIEGNNIELTIRNYQNEHVEETIRTNSEENTINITENGITRANFELEEGENIIEIEDQDFDKDSILYIASRQNEELNVYLAENDRYIQTVLDVIGNIEKTEDLEGADVVILNQENSDENYNLEEIAEDGVKPIITQEFIEQTNNDLFNSASSNNTDVEFSSPTTHTIAETQVMALGNLNITESWTRPEEAVAKIEAQENEFYVLNIAQEDLQYDLIFPNIWQELIYDSVELKSAQEINNRLPSQNEEGEEITSQGFEEIEGQLRAFNTIQSYTPITVQEDEQITGDDAQIGQEKESYQNHLISLLILLIVLDVIYLTYKGDLKF